MRMRSAERSFAAVLAVAAIGLTMRVIAALIPGAAFDLASVIATAIFVVATLALGYFLVGIARR